MELRPLGKTGLTVSALGFGCGAIGGLMVKGDPGEQERAVARAIDAGIRYFDTAPSYGDGRSEEHLGRVLRDLGSARTERIVVGTKLRVDAGVAAGPAAGVTKAIRESVEQSLRRLGRERVHLMQLHNQIAVRADANGRGLTPEQVTGPVAEGLRAVREAGLVEHVGFTATGDPAAVRRVVESGAVETGQFYFNALNPSAGYAGAAEPGRVDFDGVIDVAAAREVGVIVIRSLAAGAVTASEVRHANAGGTGGIVGERYEDDVRKAQALSALAADLGLDGPVELALRFAMGKASVSTVIVGFSSEPQLADALRWAERGALPPDATRQVLELSRR
ncbi:MAG TPA: aldo/keto reductase [Chloroflexota bacterium]|nr:aldo/keto reductase [Chloroflexota bacterium]